MTNPSLDPTVGGPEDIEPVSSREAAEAERNKQSAEAGDQADKPQDDHSHHVGRHRR